MDTDSALASDDALFPLDPDAAPTTITLEQNYLVEVLVRSTSTQSFVPLISNVSTPVKSIMIDGNGTVTLFDADGNDVVSQATTSLATLPILQLRVETADDVFEEEIVFGSNRIRIADPSFTLPQQDTAGLVGPYALIEGKNRARVVDVVAAALNLPDLPDGRTVINALDAGHLFDFIVALEQPGDIAVIVLTLRTAAQTGARYHKYREDTGAWEPFAMESILSPNDRIYSAPWPCPAASASRAPDSGVWQRADGGIRGNGHRCLLLEIQDGSANDADGRADSYVVDAGALDNGQDSGSGPDAGAGTSGGGGGGGGGAAGLWWLLGAVIVLGTLALRQRSLRQTRARRPG